jgi:hypothetical protein
MMGSTNQNAIIKENHNAELIKNASGATFPKK